MNQFKRNRYLPSDSVESLLTSHLLLFFLMVEFDWLKCETSRRTMTSPHPFFFKFGLGVVTWMASIIQMVVVTSDRGPIKWM